MRETQARRWTREEYHRMAEAGILGEDDRVELLDGEIVAMTPIGGRHAACVNRLIRLFTQRLSDRVVVAVQNPVGLGDYSEPQPDAAILRPRSDFYEEHPGPDDTLLVVEVADTSAGSDRAVKVPLYAREGIAEVWLVDLGARRIERYWNPSAQGYQDSATIRPGERLAVPGFPDVEIAAEEVLV